jgi:A/G-specific adenine glycosylase
MTGRTPPFALCTPQSERLVPLLLEWFAANARDLPWRRTRDPYAIWVSEIMLQQTQVKTVIPFWDRWMRELPTIEAAAKASPAKIHKLWEGLGYYTRVRNLQKAAKQIVTECRRRGNESQTKGHSETPYVVSYKFPEHLDDVLALPGIGRYTAGAICSLAFNQPRPILDGNVIRVLTRIFGIAENPKGKETNARLWKLAEEFVTSAALLKPSRSSRRKEVPSSKAESGKRKAESSQSLLTSAATIKGNCSALNQSLMELGALVCTPRNAQCGICPVNKICAAFRENRVEELPNPGKRKVVTTRRFVAFVVEKSGHFLVRQRPAGVVNGHLWEFPNTEVVSTQSSSGRESAHHSRNNSQRRLTSVATARKSAPEIVRAGRQLGFELHQTKLLITVKHSITRYRITLEAFHVNLGGTSFTSPRSKTVKSGTRPSEKSSQIGIWKTPAQLGRLAFTAAHKKILTKIGL